MILPALLLTLYPFTLKLDLPIGTTVELEISESWKAGEEEVVSFGRVIDAKVVAGSPEFPVALSGTSIMTSWRIDGQEVKLLRKDPSPWVQRFKTDLMPELAGGELGYRLQRCTSIFLPLEPVENALRWKWKADALALTRIPPIEFQLGIPRFSEESVNLEGAFREQDTDEPMNGTTKVWIDKNAGWILNQTTVVNNARIPGGDNQAVTYIYKLKTVKLTKPVK